MMQTLGMASEALVMRGLSTFADHATHIVQTTPTEPDYWFGNQVIVRDARVSAGSALGWFTAAHPKASHIVFSWDLPFAPSDQIDPGFAAAGCSLQHSDVLALAGAIADAPVPVGISIRAITKPTDWAQAEALQLEIGAEEGRSPDLYRGYIQRRNISRRAQIADGLGQWFGAFEGDLLVAQMGMFHDDRVARYQSVETRASHRCRGICAALLRHCCLWAHDRAPKAQPVIIAEADSAAGRLYRRMGFAHIETLTSAMKEGS